MDKATGVVKLSLLLRCQPQLLTWKCAEETLRVPRRAWRCVPHTDGQRSQHPIELNSRFAIDCLFQIVRGAMIPLFDEGVECALLGAVRTPAELERQRGDAVLHETCLVRPYKAILVRLFVELHFDVVALRGGPGIIPKGRFA